MNKRKIVLEVIEDGRVSNRRLAEYFAEKFNERGIKNGR
jgi:hypothetical protein